MLFSALVVVSPRAAAAPPLVGTVLSLEAFSGFAGTARPVTVLLTDVAGQPVPDAVVVVERVEADGWREFTTLVTDASGRAVASAVLSRRPQHNAFRARFAGSATHSPSESTAVTAELRRRRSVLTLRGPGKVVDGRRITLRLRWRTRQGEPVAGRVQVQKRQKGRWRTIARRRTGAQGRARVRLRPRQDVRLRAVATALPWVEGARSRRKRIDNVPPAPPVRLPEQAPQPRIKLPAQRRAVGKGANVNIMRIPDGVWRSMVGRSWHRGCPVGRSGLRLLRANYIHYSGYRRRGELVVAASAAQQFAGMLRELHRRQVPMRSMYRVDRFGWSRDLGGADDRRSMAAGNTSVFNCREVVGRQGVVSPHSYGRSFDLNPWENPYRVNGGWLPNSWWVGRTHPRVAWRGPDHAVVSILRRHGFSWTYGTSDAHHFDARTPSGRIVARCASVEQCH